jgi:hypothetical protein
LDAGQEIYFDNKYRLSNSISLMVRFVNRVTDICLNPNNFNGNEGFTLRLL